MTGSGADEEFLELLRNLARLEARSASVEEAIEGLVRVAVRVVDGAEDGSITLLEEGRLATLGATSKTGRVVDAVQHATGEGPCLSSAVRHRTRWKVRSMSPTCGRRWRLTT